MDILMALTMELVPIFYGYPYGIIHGMDACILWIFSGIYHGINVCIYWTSKWQYPWDYCLHLQDFPMTSSMDYMPVLYGYPNGIIHGTSACIS